MEGEKEGEKAQVVEGKAWGGDLPPAEEGPLGRKPRQEEEPPGEGLHQGGGEGAEEELEEAEGHEEGHQGEGEEVGEGGEEGAKPKRWRRRGRRKAWTARLAATPPRR